jgi:hypothetical protein
MTAAKRNTLDFDSLLVGIEALDCDIESLFAVEQNILKRL